MGCYKVGRYLKRVLISYSQNWLDSTNFVQSEIAPGGISKKNFNRKGLTLRISYSDSTDSVAENGLRKISLLSLLLLTGSRSRSLDWKSMFFPWREARLTGILTGLKFAENLTY
jgi:hypothetical protein